MEPRIVPESSPRLVELVNELVGAQTVAKMVNDAIGNLTEEQKKQIADAMFDRAMAFVKANKDKYRIESLLTDLVNTLIRKRVATDDELVDRLTKAAYAQVEARWPQAVEMAANHWIARALAAVRKKFDAVARGF